MSAETLRKAASAIRDEWGESGPTGGAWHRERDFYRAVADWLDDQADVHKLARSLGKQGLSPHDFAFTVARAYLGES